MARPMPAPRRAAGHQVPGMRGLYAHASDRMRDDLKRALQARWGELLRDRAEKTRQ